MIDFSHVGKSVGVFSFDLELKCQITINFTESYVKMVNYLCIIVKVITFVNLLEFQYVQIYVEVCI